MLVKNNSVLPISQSLQQQVIEQTNHFLKSAAEYYQRDFNKISILFDLKGRAAGMYRVRGTQRTTSKSAIGNLLPALLSIDQWTGTRRL